MTDGSLWSGTIPYEPASKENSRQLHRTGPKCGKCGKRMGPIQATKSEKALAFVKAAGWSIKAPKEPITEKVVFVANLYYATERPDLDESLVLDCLQKFGVIKNDRQIRSKLVSHGIDKVRPRVEIRLHRYG